MGSRNKSETDLLNVGGSYMSFADNLFNKYKTLYNETAQNNFPGK